MNNNLTHIAERLKSEQIKARLALALDLDATKDNSEVSRYCASVLAEVEKTAGDTKKDLTQCTADSIAQCMIDAAKFGLMLDGRQHAHLIKYGRVAQLQVGYRGYLYIIKRHYPDADFTVVPIYDGDDLVVTEHDGAQSYTLTRTDPMRDGEEGLTGMLVAVSYTDPSTGRLIQKVTPVPRSRIDRARNTAKQDYIWQSDFVEKAKAAAIKNAFKHMFAQLTALQDAITYDNKHGHNLEEADPKNMIDAQSDEFTDADIVEADAREPDFNLLNAASAVEEVDGGFICPETGELIKEN